MIALVQHRPSLADHVDRHLNAAGYTLVGRFGKQERVDGRVALRDGMLAFVLVRSRCVGAGRRPLALTAARQRQLRAVAAHWLAERPHAGHRLGEPRFDQVTQTLDDLGRLVVLEHLEGVF